LRFKLQVLGEACLGEKALQALPILAALLQVSSLPESCLEIRLLAMSL
jgi:hypothetical protein